MPFSILTPTAVELQKFEQNGLQKVDRFSSA